jgi:hypothetical protein
MAVATVGSINMTNIKLPTGDAQLLFSVAEQLLRCGKDRAADFIFAALEAEEPDACGCTAGTWEEAFAA